MHKKWARNAKFRSILNSSGYINRLHDEPRMWFFQTTWINLQSQSDRSQIERLRWKCNFFLHSNSIMLASQNIVTFRLVFLSALYGFSITLIFRHDSVLFQLIHYNGLINCICNFENWDQSCDFSLLGRYFNE